MAGLIIGGRIVSKYTTDQERRSAKARQDREAGKRRSDRERLRRPVGIVKHAAGRAWVHEQEEDRPPPEVLAAQKRRIDFVVRALASGQCTPNQWFLGEPVKRGKTCSSLSQTQVMALLG
jgi:hypothetical protein